jgi:hypothetical protein
MSRAAVPLALQLTRPAPSRASTSAWRGSSGRRGAGPDPAPGRGAAGVTIHDSCLSLPNSRSTALRLRYRSYEPLRPSRDQRVQAVSSTEAGSHSPVGQRHFVARRF